MRAPRGLFYGRRKREAFEVAWRAMRFGDGLAGEVSSLLYDIAAVAVPRRWGSSRNLAPCSRPRPTCGEFNNLAGASTFPFSP